MKTDIKNFPRGLDEKDLLYLIWLRLGEMGGGSGSGGGDGSGCDCDPVEANPTIGESDETTPLEALKVGESVYTVGGGLAPMIVEGTIDGSGTFTPGEGAASWPEAQAQMFNGGLLYLVITDDGEPVAVYLATTAEARHIGVQVEVDYVITWVNPSDDDIM